MDSMNAIDHELSQALGVQPSGDFAARVRARIGTEPPSSSRWSIRALALAGGGVVSMALVAISLSSPATTPVDEALPNRPLAIFTPLAVEVAADSPAVQSPAAAGRIVLVAPSEMLALQRLFAGELIAPPENPAAAELVINEVAIDPIAVPIIEGEQR